MSAPERIHTGRVLVVEGKYDAARLARLTDAMILPTGGFAIFSDRKRQQLLKELAARNGLILLTDSDRAGFQIRTYITNLVGAERVVQAYVPALPGKERRKAAPGKEGLLGVEGVPDELIRKSLHDALGPEAGQGSPAARPGRAITYGDLYDWGLSGTAGAAERKYRLLEALGLPPRLSKKEMLEVFNRLYTFEQLDALIQAAGEGEKDGSLFRRYTAEKGAVCLFRAGQAGPSYPALDGLAQRGQVRAGQQLEADGPQAREPQLQLAVQVGQAGRLDGVGLDAPVGQDGEGFLHPGDPLHIDGDDPAGGKDHPVADALEGLDDLFAGAQQGRDQSVQLGILDRAELEISGVFKVDHGAAPLSWLFGW